MQEFEQNIFSLLPEFIFGAEDDDDPNADSTGNDDNNSGDPGENNDSGDDNGANNGGTNDEDDGRTKALKAERKLRSEAEKEAKRLARENEELRRKDLDELERTKAERDDALSVRQEDQAKLAKLTEGFRRSAIIKAITDEATKQNFIDVADALAGVDEDSLGVEQDDDDPTQVTIDLKAVASAVKKLATSKPHYINKGTDDGDPTGSQFGGSRRKNKDEDTETTLRNRYPNL